jgi:hypothetical protein
MTEKQRKELESATRLFEVLNIRDPSITSSDRPDILALLNNWRIGLEITELHSDETPTSGGSRLRADEERKKYAAADRAYFMWVNTNFLPAFHQRVNDKVQRAKNYSADSCDELWLLVACQLPHAVASTYVFSPFVLVDSLNRKSHEVLFTSSYCRAYLHLQLDNILLEWTPSKKWHTRSGLREQPTVTDDLWFKNLDEDWFRDPDKKMAEEFHKAIEEIQRNKSPIDSQ